ncbi:MAG: hypothetical protein IIC74_06815 [Bacteroidetes bacterium]|nr:hypothetical protein [Bacteroidota bacterium]
MKEMERLSKKDINLKEWEYEYQQRDRHTILMSDLWSRALFGNFEREIDLPVGHLDAKYTTSSKAYTKVDKKKKLMEALRKACEDDKYVKYVHDMTLNRMKEQLELCKDIAGKIKEDMSKEEIVNLWKKFDKQFMDVIPWYYIPYYIVEDNLISDRVKKGLEKHKGEIEKITDMNNALMVLMFPKKKAEFQKEQSEVYELVRKAKNGEKYESGTENYLKKYSWMKTFIVLPTEPLSLDELRERVEEALEENSLEDYKLQLKQKEKNTKLAKKLIDKVKGDKGLIKNIEWARKYGFMLTSSVEQSLIAMSKLIPFYKLIAENLKVKYDKWIHLTSEEIVGILEDKIDTHGMIFISVKFVDLNFEEKIIQEEIIIEKNDDLAILVKYTQRIYDKSFARIDIKIYDAEQNRLNDFYQNYGFIPNTHIEILVVDEENQEFYSTDGIINDKELLEIEFYIPENSKRETLTVTINAESENSKSSKILQIFTLGNEKTGGASGATGP